MKKLIITGVLSALCFTLAPASAFAADDGQERGCLKTAVEETAPVIEKLNDPSLIPAGNSKEAVSQYTPASAQTRMGANEVSIKKISEKYIPSKLRVYGTPGMNITIKEGKTFSVTGTLSSTVSGEVSAVFAKASASVGVSIALAKTLTTETSGSWTVPAGVARGYIEAGVLGRVVVWQKQYFNATQCKWIPTGEVKNVSGVTTYKMYRNGIG